MLPLSLSRCHLLLTLCLSTGLTQACPKCDDGYEYFPSWPGSRYKMPPFHLDWHHALAACQSDGGGSHLVVINSQTEAEVVKTMVGRLLGTRKTWVWVGINDFATEGTWITVLGGLVSASGYSKWTPGSPDDGTKGNCGYVYPDGLYRDDTCADVGPFICEKPN